ncbi:hypothetical protein [Flavobacterium gilvum]|uniref:Nucleotidyltransferase n=1 Tax=Flavobacterium gilvum TaxID=1492737 RepID=A0AAC9I7S4_9FLAO|nr:hypothetical protein [Flavobacterium gilvum]AOW09527.1 hypothetical protein EM308_08445 [Flavobacterium gilvum]KFC60034.1 hypothetical protein FEM08_12130 [Flavobacterium gilvum]
MARDIKEIKQTIGQAYLSNEVVRDSYGLSEGAVFEDEFSIVSLESIAFGIVAFAHWLLETLFDTHKKEVDDLIAQQKSATVPWYKNMALAFQYGFALLTDTDRFDNTGFTDEEITASKIVKYCSVNETGESNRLVVKIAGETGGELSPLLSGQIASFTAYMNDIKYAGVKISVINNPADALLLYLDVYRDPLVLDSTGVSIANGNKPIDDAIKQFLKLLPFDGAFIINDFIAYLRAVDGVINVHVLSASSASYNMVSHTYGDFVGIAVKKIPEAGYFQVTNFDNINYVV